MTTKTRRLTGGFAGYRRACNEAYTVNMHNPSLVYSEADGFTVTSMHCPLSDGEVRLGEAYYSLNAGGDRSYGGTRSEYEKLRVYLVTYLGAIAAGKSHYQAHEAGCLAQYDAECPR